MSRYFPCISGGIVKKSVDECIEEGILKEFFVKNKAEVISMTIFEYDEEEHMRLEREELLLILKHFELF